MVVWLLVGADWKTMSFASICSNPNVLLEIIVSQLLNLDVLMRPSLTGNIKVVQ